MAGYQLGAVLASQFGKVARLGARRVEMGLDAGAHTRQISQQSWVIEVVALARLDGVMRGATRDGALQRIELAQRSDQLLALCRGFGQRHRRLPQQQGSHEKSGHAAMRGAQPDRSQHRAIPV